MNENKPLPKLIYKYLRIDENLNDLISNCQFWFSNPQDFNDPYDCNISFKKNYSKEDVISFFEKVGSEKGMPLTKSQIDNKVIEWFINPSPLKSKSIEGFKSFIKSKGVCCFSAINDNVLMWSHYADSHKGICIGFDSNYIKKYFNIIKWVDYSKEFPEINLLTEMSKSVTKIMSHKSDDWKYEEEIRILQLEKKAYPFPKEAIKEVVFGIRVTEEHIFSVFDMLNKLGCTNIKYKMVVLDETTYKVLLSQADFVKSN